LPLAVLVQRELEFRPYPKRRPAAAFIVIKRLEEKAKSDRALSRRLKALAKKISDIKS